MFNPSENDCLFAPHKVVEVETALDVVLIQGRQTDQPGLPTSSSDVPRFPTVNVSNERNFDRHHNQTVVPTDRRNDLPKKLTDFHETLERAPKADALRPKHNRRSAKALFAEIKADGYAGGYSQLTAFVRNWRGKPSSLTGKKKVWWLAATT